MLILNLAFVAWIEDSSGNHPKLKSIMQLLELYSQRWVAKTKGSTDLQNHR